MPKLIVNNAQLLTTRLMIARAKVVLVTIFSMTPQANANHVQTIKYRIAGVQVVLMMHTYCHAIIKMIKMIHVIAVMQKRG